AALRGRVDGDGALRRGAAARGAQYAGALQSEPSDFGLRGRRDSEDAGAGAGSRAERGAHTDGRDVPAIRRSYGAKLGGGELDGGRIRRGGTARQAGLLCDSPGGAAGRAGGAAEFGVGRGIRGAGERGIVPP